MSDEPTIPADCEGCTGAAWQVHFNRSKITGTSYGAESLVVVTRENSPARIESVLQMAFPRVGIRKVERIGIALCEHSVNICDECPGQPSPAPVRSNKETE